MVSSDLAPEVERTAPPPCCQVGSRGQVPHWVFSDTPRWGSPYCWAGMGVLAPHTTTSLAGRGRGAMPHVASTEGGRGAHCPTGMSPISPPLLVSLTPTWWGLLVPCHTLARRVESQPLTWPLLAGVQPVFSGAFA